MNGFKTKYLSYFFSFSWGLGLACICAKTAGYQLQIGVALLCVLMAGYLILFSNRILKANDGEFGPSNFLGREVLVNAILLHLCLIVGLGAFGVGQQLWVPDSKGLHMPGVNTVLSFFNGESGLPMGSAFGGRVQVTYLWVGLWVWLFGSSPVVTSLALLVIKLLTWILLLKESHHRFGGRLASLALLLMAFAPTQIFYSVVL